MAEGKIIDLNKHTEPKSESPLIKKGVPAGQKNIAEIEEARAKQTNMIERATTPLNMENISKIKEFITNNNKTKFTQDRLILIEKYKQTLINKTNEELIKLANESSIIDWNDELDYYIILLEQLTVKKLIP